MKVCDKTCIFCFFPIINKYLCMAKRSLLSRFPSYILTPCSRVLEKLTGFQVVKKFPAFCGPRRFITAFTSARHLPLSCLYTIQKIYYFVSGSLSPVGVYFPFRRYCKVQELFFISIFGEIPRICETEKHEPAQREG